jgi:hypothetical protein
MIVTLDVFSGRPNPSWTLSDKDKRELISRVAGKAVSAVHESEGPLGFRGYIVSAASDDDDTATSAGLPDMFRITSVSLGGIVPDSEQLVRPLSTEEVADAQAWLLTTVAGAVEDPILEHVTSQISGTGAMQALAEAQAPAAAAACVISNTPYNPGFWNVPSVQPYNNCYNYAMNYRSNTFAQPGRISGHPNNVMQCANVAAAANWDGCRATCSGPNKNVALVIWPGQDYHWYRLHSNGFWGHKPGGTIARNWDSLNRVIGGALNPQNCARGPYTIFCGYRFSPVGMHVS